MSSSPNSSAVKTASRHCVALLAVLAIVFVCTYAALRVAMPWVTQQRGAIEKLVSMTVGRPVSVGAVDLEWRGFMPSLRLQEVTVLNDARDPVLRVGSMSMKPAALGSLFDRRLQLAAMHVIGAEVHIVRTRAGEIKVRGLNLRPGAAPQGLRNIMLTALSSRVRWEDRRLDVDYRFMDVDLALNTHGARNRLAVRLNLPRELGGSFVAIADLQGALRAPATWQGKVYLKAEDVQAASLPADLRIARLRGKVTSESWGEWREGQLAEVVGSLSARDVSLVNAAAPDLDYLRGNFRWQRRAHGWTVDLADLRLTRAGRSWPSSAASVNYRDGTGGQARLRGAVGYLRLEDAVALLLSSQRLDDARAANLTARAPRGKLRENRFELSLKDEQIIDYVVAGRFSDLGLDPTSDKPGFSGADGRFRIANSSGTMALDGRDVKVQHPGLFAAPLSVDFVRGRLRWRREEDQLDIESPALVAGNEDVAVRGRFALRLGDASPHLDMQAQLANGNVAHIDRYLPVKTMKPKLYEWLARALVDARLTRGRVIFKGDLADFPFREHEGVFEAYLDVEQGILDYRPDWPRAEAIDATITLRGPSLAVIGRKARVLESQIETASVDIADLREGDLKLRAVARGPIGDIVEYLQRSSLVKAETFDRFAVEGQTRLDLDLRLPLSEALKQTMQPQVRAVARFDDASLRISPWDLAFTNVDGGVTFFSPEGFHAQDVNARFRGETVQVDIAAGADKSTGITVTGQLPAAALLEGMEHSVLGQIEGTSAWQAHVGLPPFKAPSEEPTAPAPVRLSLQSDLVGTTIDLPQPLGKLAGESRQFTLTTAAGGDKAHPIRARYGAAISAVLALTNEGSSLKLARGELRINRGSALLPDRGVFIKATLAEFDVGAWGPWLKSATKHQPRNQGADAGVPWRGLEAAVDRVEFSGNTFEDVRLNAHRGRQRWIAAVDSSLLKGRIAAPLRFDSNVPFIANLEFLHWTTGQGGEAIVEVDPRSLPPLRIESERLHVDELEFSDVLLRTARTRDGLQVQRLELAAPDFQGSARGAWRVAEARQLSSFDLMLESQDIGALLRRWDLLHNVREGVTDLDAHFNWPGGPFSFGLQGMEGRAALRVENGRLREINPGAGRLLGLLNIDAIARRLTLNFSDLFRTGFSFDSINGDFNFDEGVMRTENVSIKGPSAEIDITGRVGLVASTYDLRVAVMPELISGLPLAGAILGGPIVGAAVYVAGKIAEEIDSGIDEGPRILYAVTGPWKDPQVKVLEAPRAPTKAQRNFPYNQR